MDVFSLVGKVKLEGADQVNDQLQQTKSSTEGLQKGLMALGAAFTAAGAAGLKFSADARKLNASLGQTAITLGVSTKEMRDLALSTTNVTFPLKSVTATFDLLARAGIRSKEEMKSVANAFDALADATGSSAEAVADILIPAFKSLGVALPKSSAELDKFTWLTKNTTVELSEFGSVMQYVAMYGSSLNVSLDDMIAIMAALEARGISGSAATRLFRTAVTQAQDGAVSLNEALGVSQIQIDAFRQQMEGAVGVTDQYAAVANEQFGIMDKIKQKFEELTLVAGSYLTPLEPILALMTAMGPVMLFLGTSAGPKLIATLKGLTTWFIATGRAAWKSVAGLVAAAAAKIWAWASAIPFIGVGLAIAGVAALIASIFAIKSQMEKFQYGGVISEPTILYGMRSRRPYAIAGEAGTEYVVPKGVGLSPEVRTGDVIHINLGVLPGDDITIRRVARMIKEVLGEEGRRTAFGQVNQGYFYGRSSI